MDKEKALNDIYVMLCIRSIQAGLLILKNLKEKNEFREKNKVIQKFKEVLQTRDQCSSVETSVQALSRFSTFGNNPREILTAHSISFDPNRPVKKTELSAKQRNVLKSLLNLDRIYENNIKLQNKRKMKHSFSHWIWICTWSKHQEMVSFTKERSSQSLLDNQENFSDILNLYNDNDLVNSEINVFKKFQF
ncbi:unnamed protein product [Moneuplotes crassus]|uniref:Uncharacterized protein n=1 Tax=Euplotes crassus TaxID=5936 RepID=A0AAD1XVK1_EUPCR|nr:unnamed protein product [Moneuplotes crassus]